METIRREHHWDRGEGGGRLFPELSTLEAVAPTARHVSRFLELARERRRTDDPTAPTPEDLYLVDAGKDTVREIIGVRVRGHAVAILGAVRFPRQKNSPIPYGRPSLAFFFSRPPTELAVGTAAPPEGSIEVFLPRVGETIPEMVARLRENPGGAGIRLDVDLVEFAFDFRFRNPSAIPLHGMKPEKPQRQLFRTVGGHVLSGLSVGFHKAVRRGLDFISLTDAMQHRHHSSDLLPTLALNRRVLVVETAVERNADAAATLAFHPSTANATHILGLPYDELGA